MRRFAAFAVLSLALLGLSGCKGACRELSEKVCDCSTNSVQRELCIRRAANDEARVEPTAEQEAVCEMRIDACQCEVLQPNREDVTEEDIAREKVDCGLSRGEVSP